MAKILKTSHVSIDTSIFHQHKFLWDEKRIKKLQELSDEGKISLYLPKVIIDEISSGMKKMLDEAIQAHKNFKKEAAILSNAIKPDLKPALNRLDKDSILSQINKKFIQYLKKAKIEILNSDTVSVDEMLHKYFNSKAPFGTGDKKAEFPDAIALEVLKKWCENNSEQMYVISDDSDWKRTCDECEELIYLRKIDELFDLINREKEISKAAIKIFDKKIRYIKEKIKDDFNLLGFYLEDEWGDVTDTTVTEIIISDKYLTSIDNGRVTFIADAEIDFNANVVFEDYDTAVYDSEEKELLFSQTINDTIESSILIEVEVIIAFNPDDEKKISIENISIEGSDIGITVNRYPHPYYDLK